MACLAFVIDKNGCMIKQVATTGHFLVIETDQIPSKERPEFHIFHIITTKMIFLSESKVSTKSHFYHYFATVHDCRTPACEMIDDVS